MHTLQDTMPILVDPGDSLASWRTPSQEDHASRPHFRNSIYDLLGELLPALVGVAVRLVRSNRQTCVQQQHTTISPRREKSTVLWRWLECRIIFADRNIDVFQGWWSRRRGADGEAEAVSLVDVVIGVLAQDDGFDRVERSMPGPESQQRRIY